MVIKKYEGESERNVLLAKEKHVYMNYRQRQKERAVNRNVVKDEAGNRRNRWKKM
jgi:hypothetical protein